MSVAQLASVHGALARIEKGNYGICERCGQEINPERLEYLRNAFLHSMQRQVTILNSVNGLRTRTEQNEQCAAEADRGSQDIPAVW